ncbi:MAG: NPCBM/NEW2 domain-containing protein [Planctomycetia bacterium]|nr:NPCBM/NEW2 domain-containing protein [Planctomycetia bacterium]
MVFKNKPLFATVPLVILPLLLCIVATPAQGQKTIPGAMVIEDFAIQRYYRAQNARAEIKVSDGTGGGPPAGTKILTFSGMAGSRPFPRVWLRSPIPGKASKITLYIRCDGNPVSLGTMFTDRYALVGSGETAAFVPDTFQSAPPTLVDWKGWKKITINVPVKGKKWTFNPKVTARTNQNIVDFPLALDGFIMAHPRWAMKDDDPRKKKVAAQAQIKVNLAFAMVTGKSDILPAEQFWARADLGRPGNILARGEDATIYVFNRAAGGPHKVRCEIRAFDAAGRVALKLDKDLNMRGGIVVPLKFSTSKLSGGWYRLTVNLIQNGKTVFILKDPEKQYKPEEEAAFKKMPILQVLTAPSFAILEARDIPAGKAFRTIFSSMDRLSLEMEETANVIRFTWDDIERRHTRWQWYIKIPRSDSAEDFERHSLDEIVARVRKAGLEPVGKLAFCAQWAAKGGEEKRRTGMFTGSPLAVPKDKRFFADYVYRVVKRYRDKIKVWEVWDEPDMKPEFDNDPALFIEMLLKPAYEAAKRADPNCTVLVGGVSIQNFQRYVIGLVRNGGRNDGANYFDGISIHIASSFFTPEESEFINLLEGGKKYLSAKMGKGREPVFWLTKISFPSGIVQHGLSTGMQGGYLTRAFILSKAANIKQFITDIDSAGRKEEGGGVVVKHRYPSIFPISAPEVETYSLKAGYLMMRSVRRIMKGKEFRHVITLRDITPGMPRCLIFEDNSQALFALWRVRGDVTMKLTPPPGVTLSAVDSYGNALTLASKGGKVAVPLGSFPIFLRVPRASTTALEHAMLGATFEPAEGAPRSWRSNLVDSIVLDSAAQRQSHQYKVTGGKIAPEKADNTFGDSVNAACATHKGEETFNIKLPAFKTPQDIVMVRGLLMTEKGESITVTCNGKEIATMAFGHRGRPPEPFRLWTTQTIIIPADALKKNPKEAQIKITAKDREAKSGSYWFYAKPAGTALALSDVEPLAYRRPWGQLYHNTNIGGVALAVAGREYEKGIGTTADSRITYLIGGNFKTLKGQVGVDALAESSTRVRVSIYLDGRSVWNRRGIKKDTPPVDFEISVEGKNQIMFEARSESGNLRYDFVDWLNIELR